MAQSVVSGVTDRSRRTAESVHTEGGKLHSPAKSNAWLSLPDYGVFYNNGGFWICNYANHLRHTVRFAHGADGKSGTAALNLADPSKSEPKSMTSQQIFDFSVILTNLGNPVIQLHNVHGITKESSPPHIEMKLSQPLAPGSILASWRTMTWYVTRCYAESAAQEVPKLLLQTLNESEFEADENNIRTFSWADLRITRMDSQQNHLAQETWENESLTRLVLEHAAEEMVALVLAALCAQTWYYQKVNAFRTKEVGFEEMGTGTPEADQDRPTKGRRKKNLKELVMPKRGQQRNRKD